MLFQLFNLIAKAAVYGFWSVVFLFVTTFMGLVIAPFLAVMGLTTIQIATIGIAVGGTQFFALKAIN